MSFYQLRTSLEYNGIETGVEVIAVLPSYTSQACDRWGAYWTTL